MNSEPFVILDGGLATELEAAGHSLADHLWSARLLQDAPDDIQTVHRRFLQAGADVIATASYQASFAGFREAGLNDAEAESLLVRSVTLASEVIDSWSKQSERPRVAASIGSFGACLADGSEYRGNYGISKAELLGFHERRWRILADQKPDLMLCETIPNFAEIQVLGELSQETSAPTWISMSCKNPSTLADGTGISQCVEWLNHIPNVQAIGINCCSPSLVAPFLCCARELTDKRLMAYPNSGESYSADSKSWSGPETVSDWTRFALDWIRAGATTLGGCCRTTPEQISNLRRTVDSLLA